MVLTWTLSTHRPMPSSHRCVVPLSSHHGRPVPLVGPRGHSIIVLCFSEMDLDECGMGVLTVESWNTQRQWTMDVHHRLSFSCHVAVSDVAPGCCVRGVSGRGRWASHLCSLSSCSIQHAGGCLWAAVVRFVIHTVGCGVTWFCNVRCCRVWWWWGWLNDGGGGWWHRWHSGGGWLWGQWWLRNKSFVCWCVCFCCFWQTPLMRLSIKEGWLLT